MKTMNTYNETPNIFSTNVRKLHWVGENLILSYIYLGTKVNVKVSEQGWYTEDGKLHKNVVGYKLSEDEVAPMLRLDAEKQVEFDKQAEEDGTMPIGMGVIVEI